MKVIDPDGSVPSRGVTKTFTQRLTVLAPSRDDLVDAGFLAALLLTALVGFTTSFDSAQFLWVGAVGVVLGMLIAHLAAALRWHWVTTAVLAVVIFFLLGGAVALRADMIAGFIPSLATLGGLARLSVAGWKDLLTTLPPVDGSGQLLVLPYLMGVTSASLGFSVARRSRNPYVAVVAPLATLALVILVGTMQPPAVLLQGVVFALGSFGWVVIRSHRRGRIRISGSSPRSQVVNGAALLALATLLGGVGYGYLPEASSHPRFVLRSYLVPPVDLSEYASPLLGFRKFSSEPLKLVYDQNLLSVTGAPAGSLVRFAVMDDYSGTAWAAVGQRDPSPASGFQRVGAEIPNAPTGAAKTITITVEPAYAALIDLNAWVPSLGPSTRTEFSGANARSHAGTFRYNLNTGQGIIPDRFASGDTVTVTSVPLPVKSANDLQPQGSVVVASERYAAVTPYVQKYAANQADPAKQLAAVAAALKAGAWSDGTLAGEMEYTAGHYQGRLQRFLAAKQLVGSDEHYAAAFALMASRIGYPARVVLGAVAPEGGTIKGKDVVAWVELQTTQGWVTIDRSAYVPERTKRPDQTPPDPVSNSKALDVPPPNPAQPPANLDTLFDTDPAAKRVNASDQTSKPWLPAWVLAVLPYVATPIGVILLTSAVILGTKAVRRARRRSTGTPVDRVTRGWDEIVDVARDLGLPLVPGSTRQEQAAVMARPEARDAAVLADRGVFGQGEPSGEAVAAMWGAVKTSSAAMWQSKPLGRRLLARLSLRSLLPDRTWATSRSTTPVKKQTSRLKIKWGTRAAT